MLIDNLHIIIDKESKWYEDITKYLIKIEEDEVKEIYNINDDEDIEIDRGLRFLLPQELIKECIDVSSHDIDVDIKQDKEFYRNILDDISLRDDQILTVMKCLYHKRGLCQCSTGSGKTICIAALIQYYYRMLGYYPNTLIFEPTNYLVEQTIERFREYGIPATKYSDSRNKIEGVVISHPMSLYNDLKKDDSIFDDVKIFIGDEYHHQSCNTWYTIYNGLSGVEVALGFSASIIDSNKLPITDISQLDYNESVLFGCTGNIIVDIPASYYIQIGVLATPVLFRMYNPASEWVYDDKNWHQLRKNKLESANRTKLICDTTTVFNIFNYKVLILTFTKNHAESIIRKLKDYGISDKCVCSYGGGVYLKLDKETDELIDCRDEDPKSKFESGELNIMIGTTHLFEGADVPHLDVVILASVGKQARKLIQGVGRGLRKTKNGNFAYIIDFTDTNSSVLRYHSELRLGMYKEIIGITPDHIFNNYSIQKLKEALKILENL